MRRATSRMTSEYIIAVISSAAEHEAQRPGPPRMSFASEQAAAVGRVRCGAGSGDFSFRQVNRK